MKNVFKVAVVAIAMTMVAFTANAQSKGDMAAGAKVAFATGNGYSNLGIGAKFQYNVIDPLRLEAEFTYFLPKKTLGVSTNLWDFMVNAHWLFRLGERVNIYPVAGLGLLGANAKVDLGEFGSHSGGSSEFAFNLGGGVDFFLSEKMFINIEAKYMVSGGGCFMPSAGIGFAF